VGDIGEIERKVICLKVDEKELEEKEDYCIVI